MNHEIDPTPGQLPEPPINPEGVAPGPISDSLPPAPATRSWFARYRRLLIPAVGLAVVGAAAAAALVIVLTPRTSVEKLVPATVDVYAVANLDPSASQKLNLLRAVHRFPDASTDQKLAEQLDKALKDSGITFTGDIQPWLGAQVALAVRMPQGNADPPLAFLAVSRDDAKAAAALAKLRTGSQGKNYIWHDTAYGGVTISVGSPSTSTKPRCAGALCPAGRDRRRRGRSARLRQAQRVHSRCIDACRSRGRRHRMDSQFQRCLLRLCQPQPHHPVGVGAGG